MPEDGRYPVMMSSSTTPYEIDKAITHYCRLKIISDMKTQIGEDVYHDIENNSQLGVILKFAGANFQWAGKHVQYLLGNMLEISKKHEIWVLADGRPLRFCLHEFEHITGLKCGLLPDLEDLESGNWRDLWKDLCLTSGDGPTWAELAEILKKCKQWSFELRKKVGLLVVIYVGLLGLHKNSRLPGRYVRLLMDLDRFESYPWGRLSFTELIKSIPSELPKISNFTLKGFVHVLVVWALEHIPKLGEMSGGMETVSDIPLLRWASRKSRRLDIEKVFKADKLTAPENKIRVKHLIQHPIETIYPSWPEDVVDQKVDNMIRDILDCKLDETFWTAIPIKPINSRKRKATEHREGRCSKEVDREEPKNARRFEEDFKEPKSKKAHEDHEEVKGHVLSSDVVSGLLQTLQHSIDGILKGQQQTNDRLLENEKAIARVDEAQRESEINRRVQEVLTEERFKRIDDAFSFHKLTNDKLYAYLTSLNPTPAVPALIAGNQDGVHRFDSGLSRTRDNAVDGDESSAGGKSVRQSLFDSE